MFNDVLIDIMILVEQNYKIYNQEFLIIIIVFKEWKHYLKNNFYLIKILFDYDNLKKLIMKKKIKFKTSSLNADSCSL